MKSTSLLKTGIFFAGMAFGIASQNLAYLNAISGSNLPIDQQTFSTKKPCSSFSIDRKGYSLSYNARNRNPDWVIEYLTVEHLEGEATRKSHHFNEDENIPKHLRSTLDDYKGKEFDKGHLAPAADYKCDLEHMSGTFFLTNVCPQCPHFNRGYWAKLEKYVRELVKKHRRADVVTGPLYLAYQEEDGNRYVKYRVIGENDVAVPTHFFKVIKYHNTWGEEEIEAYVLPNQKISSNVCLSDFQCTLEKVEKLAGVIFFPN